MLYCAVVVVVVLVGQYHPVRPIVVCVPRSGVVHILNRTYPDNQHSIAFAPGFEELTANREYVEREDEFDVIQTSHPHPLPSAAATASAAASAAASASTSASSKATASAAPSAAPIDIVTPDK